jgi:pseudaminic acid biosynthesis-associated methylase
MNNDQEQFWQGDFGNDYTARNINLVENNYQMFRKIFMRYNIDYESDIKSIIEFGAGSGQNIQALQSIFPNAEFAAVEINKTAIQELDKINNLLIIEDSVLNGNNSQWDLVLSKGLLIHIHPDNIQKAYEVLYNASNKYILLAEYYSPARREIIYRGEHDKLWAFNFWGEFQKKYPDLKVVDYMFISKYDKYPQDDITAVLFSK